MRRVLTVALVVVSAIAAGWATSPGLAQETGAGMAGHPLIGSWLVQVELEGEPPLRLPNLASFTGDGVVIVAAPALLPEMADAGAPRDVFSAGHGSWTATGAESAEVRFAFLVVDERGNPASINVVDGQLQVVEEGAVYTGQFTLTVYSGQGDVPTASGTWYATRITAGSEPMATPVAPAAMATPTAADPAASPAA